MADTLCNGFASLLNRLSIKEMDGLLSVSLTDDSQVLLAGERSRACDDEMLGLSADQRSQASRWYIPPTASSKRS
jgi:hypothetical protein